ncbi:MAG: putative quinol monooxygenase [Bacteroidota bacterium]
MKKDDVSSPAAILKTVVFILVTVFILLSSPVVHAQKTEQMVRLARIKVDPVQLKEYNNALLIQMKAAIAFEPGVLTYYAVADKKDPASITILEIYADTAAYNKHILTPHFRKYKDTVKNMVKSLELVDVNLIGIARKHGG